MAWTMMDWYEWRITASARKGVLPLVHAILSTPRLVLEDFFSRHPEVLKEALDALEADSLDSLLEAAESVAKSGDTAASIMGGFDEF
jgi:hypothetical protein